LARSATSQLFDVPDVAVLYLDRQGLILRKNSFASAICPPNAGSNFLAMLDDQSRTSALVALSDVQDGGLATLELACGLMRPGGHIRATFSRANSEAFEEELVCFIQDISDEVAMRRKMETSNKLATLGQMATGLAHELNQPLNTLNVSINNLERQLERYSMPDDLTKRRFARIYSQIDRAAKIVVNMRAFGGEVDAPRAAPFTPDERADAVLVLVEDQARLEGIALIDNLSARGVVVDGNAVGFEQVVANLVTNAIHQLGYTSGEEKQVLLQSRATSEDYVLEVTDTGGGIAEENLDRIFDPFFTTKETGEGVGLGLAISYRMIKSMGGDLTAENVVSGAKFTITLPISQSHSTGMAKSELAN